MSQLYTLYQKQLWRIFENKHIELLTLQAGVFNKQSFNNSRRKLFRKFVDNLRRHAFIILCMSSFQDYSHPIICNNDFMNYLTLAKTIFDPQAVPSISLQH